MDEQTSRDREAAEGRAAAYEAAVRRLLKCYGYHEASHAVVAASLGETVSRVAVHRPNEQPPAGIVHVEYGDAGTPDGIRNRVRVAVAGPIGSAIFEGRELEEPERKQDDQDALDAARHIDADPRRARDIVEACRVEVQQILSRPLASAQVHALAAALADRGHLEGAEVRELLEVVSREARSDLGPAGEDGGGGEQAGAQSSRTSGLETVQVESGDQDPLR